MSKWACRLNLRAVLCRSDGAGFECAAAELLSCSTENEGVGGRWADESSQVLSPLAIEDMPADINDMGKAQDQHRVNA